MHILGASHALRRDVYLKIGGYPEKLFMAGEERDLCLKMMAAGYVTRLGSADPIHHFESAIRNASRVHFYGRRNDVLFALSKVPLQDLPAHLAGTLINGLGTALRSQNPGRHLAGLVAGLVDGTTDWAADRRPVTRAIYQLHRRLKKGGPLSLAEIEALLPPLPEAL